MRDVSTVLLNADHCEVTKTTSSRAAVTLGRPHGPALIHSSFIATILALSKLAVEKLTEPFLLVICHFVCVHDVNSKGFFAATLKQSVADKYENLEFRFAQSKALK